ncbi:MAG: A24 family peptidase [bacterium]|nr:A24 family peptidase [bacterium]MDY2830270.1 A24 family peptidase [Alphaproteobacteria bacterium]
MTGYLFVAFVFGGFIPYAARRFAKFMPATFAGALVELFRWGKKNKNYRRNKLYRLFFARSVGFGFLTAFVIGAAYLHFGSLGLSFLSTYFLILFLLAEIDFRTCLLPDILTVPLLIIGFVASVIGNGFVMPNEAALGAFIGYFLPVLASLLMVWYRKDAFGGGDIKLLAALGAWLGVEGLLYVVVLSSFFGIGYACLRRRRVLAFGPMLALSGIIVAFWLF